MRMTSRARALRGLAPSPGVDSGLCLSLIRGSLHRKAASASPIRHPITIPFAQGCQGAQTSLGFREDPPMNRDGAPALEILPLAEEQQLQAPCCIQIIELLTA
jgi:hypothetical protein